MAGLLCSWGVAQRSGLPWERGRLAPDVLHQLCADCAETPPPTLSRRPLLRALAALVEGGSADGGTAL